MTMPQLEGDGPLVAVREVKVTGAMSKADALSGLTLAVPFLQEAARQTATGTVTPTGSFACGFRTEKDGTIRMLLDGPAEIRDGDSERLVDGFVTSTMEHKWKFPPSNAESLIEVRFAIGRL